MTSSGKRRLLAAGAASAVLVLLGIGPVWADPTARIQEVNSQPGTVSFILAAENLDAGQSIDPTSVTTTIGGVEAPTEATPIAQEATTIQQTAMLVMDSSGSMGEFGKLTTAKESAKLYVATLPAEVQVGLITFADDAKVVVSPTTDRATLVKAIDSLEANGSTALNDAVVLATQTLGADGSRNALLLSDGKDEGSQTSGKKARAQLTDSGVVLDSVALGRGDQEKELAAFANAGGGNVVTATNADELSAAFASAARSVATQLSVVATLPQGIESGTEELTVAAQAGGLPITATTAVLVETGGASPSASPSYGPIAAPVYQPGLLGQTWFLITVIGLVFVSLAVITTLAVGAIDAKNRKAGRVARRLDEVSALGAPGPAPAQTPQTVLGESAAVRKAVSFADKVAASRNTTALARKLEEADVTLRPGEWVVVHALIAVLAGLLATLLSDFRIGISVLAFVAGLIIPWLYLGWRAGRRHRAFYTALPDAMQMLAGSLSAGYSLPQALDNVATETGGPLGGELNRALLESRLGMPIEESLEAVAQRMESKDFHWVVMAIRINRRVGGNLSEVLTNVGKTLRERERLRRQVKALSAEGVMSMWILSLLPVFVLTFILLFRPEYIMPMLTQPIGWFLMGLGVVLMIIGLVWMRRLVNMEV